MHHKIIIALSTAALSLQLGLAQAAGKTYTEDEFLNHFSGKSSKVVAEKLGKPARKEQSVKPSNADNMLAGKGLSKDKGSKPVRVEMWYYKNLVQYDPKHTYKETEVTMVNDRVSGIAFFNNR